MVNLFKDAGFQSVEIREQFDVVPIAAEEWRAWYHANGKSDIDRVPLEKQNEYVDDVVNSFKDEKGFTILNLFVTSGLKSRI